MGPVLRLQNQMHLEKCVCIHTGLLDCHIFDFMHFVVVLIDPC